MTRSLSVKNAITDFARMKSEFPNLKFQIPKSELGVRTVVGNSPTRGSLT